MHLFGKIAIFSVGVPRGLDQKLDAARVGANDAEAAVGGAVVLVQLLQGRCDERLPDPHLGPIGQRAAFDQTDRGLIDTVAPLLRPR